MSTLKFLQSVRFVVDEKGQPAAVQLDIDAWEGLLDWLEDVEDRATVRDILPRLRKGPTNVGALNWDDVKNEWGSSELEQE